MKKPSIILLLGMFFAFLIYESQKSIDFVVLKIKTPIEIVVDLNRNGVEDNNETITLQNVQSFSTKQNKSQSELAKKMKISEEDAIGLGYLAQNFAKENLLDKKVKLEDKNSKIIIGNKSYEELLLNHGFAIKLNQKELISPDIKKNLEKIQKLHLVILNNKNHKYHHLTCKYGQIAHNSQILPAMQLSKDAKQCRFCFCKKDKNSKCNIKNKNFQNDENYHMISYVTPMPSIYKTDSIKIFLTDMTKVLKPSNSCATEVCKALVNEINCAQSSIDFAIYGYTKVPAIENALKNAQNRGVKIRFVYDTNAKGENIYPDTLYLTNVCQDNNSDHLPQLMHDKFFIFDGKTVLTGSANISNTDMSGFNSNAVIIFDSQEIADIYSKEFEQMYMGKYHKLKSKIHSENIQIGNSDIQVYFSPQDKPITQHVIPLINNAKSYIYIPAFLITHKNLADSLIAAKKRGVDVKIILDATNTHDGSTKLKYFRQNGVPVKTEIFGGKLHSKSIIIDDEYTIIGSMNFSRSGEGVNDENLVIIKDKDIAMFYRKFFQYLWARIPDKWLKLNARSESPDSIGSCSDGIDNDFDGKIDKADDSCKPPSKSLKKNRFK